MSWFFGKKKHQKDSPPSSPEEETPQGQGDEFIFIERRNPEPKPGYIDARSSSLYPSISGLPYYPPMPTQNVPQIPQLDNFNYLNCILFKYGEDLEKSIHSDMDIDRLRVNEIMSFIERIQKEDIGYGFQVEKSVIAEMDSASN